MKKFFEEFGGILIVLVKFILLNMFFAVLAPIFIPILFIGSIIWLIASTSEK